MLDLVYETTVEPEEEQQEVIHIENTHMVFKEIKADTTLAPEEEEEEQDMKEKVDKDQPHESLQPPATDILHTPQSEVSREQGAKSWELGLGRYLMGLTVLRQYATQTFNTHHYTQ